MSKEEKGRANSKQWYLENKEEHLLKCKEKYHSDEEFRKYKIQLAKDYYYANRESINERRRNKLAEHNARIHEMEMARLREYHGISAVINEKQNVEE